MREKEILKITARFTLCHEWWKDNSGAEKRRLKRTEFRKMWGGGKITDMLLNRLL